MVDVTTLAFGAAALIGFAVAAAGGYVAGHRSATAAPARLIRRAGRDSEKCLIEAATAVDVAGRLCEAVANASIATDRQIEVLVERQTRLSEAISWLRKSSRSSDVMTAVEVEWIRATVDPETELPNRETFDANIALLMARAAARPRGGLLFVSIDDAARLRNRIGETGFRSVIKSVSRVLCRAGRSVDLVCRIDNETFAVLMSDEPPADSLSNANSVRDAFRNHPFRLGADGPECLVTASFGFTPVLPSDELRLITDRALAAVTRSQRCGRNRLHAYDAAISGFSLVKPLSHATRPHASSAV